MQQIDFHFHVPNRTLYVCRLIKKVTAMNLSVAVWSTNEFLLKKAFDDLWRFEDLTFIAHAWAGSEFADDCRVVFGKTLAELPASDVVILLDEAVPADWETQLARFDRVVDIVSTRPEEVANARVRYKTYRAANVKLEAYDRSQSHG